MFPKIQIFMSLKMSKIIIFCAMPFYSGQVWASLCESGLACASLGLPEQVRTILGQSGPVQRWRLRQYACQPRGEGCTCSRKQQAAPAQVEMRDPSHGGGDGNREPATCDGTHPMTGCVGGVCGTKNPKPAIIFICIYTKYTELQKLHNLQHLQNMNYGIHINYIFF